MTLYKRSPKAYMNKILINKIPKDKDICSEINIANVKIMNVKIPLSFTISVNKYSENFI